MDPDIRLPMDMMEVLLRVVDDSRLELFKPMFGKGMITAWVHIHGTKRILVSIEAPFNDFRSPDGYHCQSKPSYSSKRG